MVDRLFERERDLRQAQAVIDWLEQVNQINMGDRHKLWDEFDVHYLEQYRSYMEANFDSNFNIVPFTTRMLATMSKKTSS